MGHSHASPCSHTLSALSNQQGPRCMLQIPAASHIPHRPDSDPAFLPPDPVCRIWWQPPVAIFGLDVFLHTLFKLKDTPEVSPDFSPHTTVCQQPMTIEACKEHVGCCESSSFAWAAGFLPGHAWSLEFRHAQA